MISKWYCLFFRELYALWLSTKWFCKRIRTTELTLLGFYYCPLEATLQVNSSKFCAADQIYPRTDVNLNKQMGIPSQAKIYHKELQDYESITTLSFRIHPLDQDSSHL